MKTVNPLTRLALSLVLSFGLVGCKKFHSGVTPINSPAVKGPDTRAPQNPLGGDVTPGNQFGGNTDPNAFGLATDPEGSTPLGSREEEGNFWLDRETFAQQTVYFEFDSSTVSPTEKAKIDAVANHMKGEPTSKLRVEGHCDERGTDEYNRALGERRALSIREYLIALGVTAERVSTISYGEDKPAMFGSDETSWAKNRRGEFVLLIPKN